MKMLIGSVYNGNAERNQVWYDLQSKFINNTTSIDYDIVICICGEENVLDFNCKTITSDQNDDGSIAHLNGLLKLKEYFGDNKYDYYTIFDSDAFPYNPKWVETSMRLLNKYDLICPFRVENLDTFGHPSICVFQDPNKIKFNIDTSHNLLKQKVNDIMCEADKIFPLLRTNKVNIHPLLYATYFDMFYHHSSGSRTLYIRSDDYYNQLPDNPPNIESTCFEWLSKHPHSFISHLTSYRKVFT
jgi:hypothetical protein